MLKAIEVQRIEMIKEMDQKRAEEKKEIERERKIVEMQKKKIFDDSILKIEQELGKSLEERANLHNELEKFNKERKKLAALKYLAVYNSYLQRETRGRKSKNFRRTQDDRIRTQSNRRHEKGNRSYAFEDGGQ
jgi:hypothetical protein